MPHDSTSKKILRIARDIWGIIGITLLLLVVIGAGICVVSRIKSLLKPPVNPRIHADSFAGVDWAKPFFRELNESSGMKWEPYLYWRRNPYRGKYINVGSDGNRVTVNAEHGEDGIKPVKIFMFGSSTLWGDGARDEFTVPSDLAQELEKKGIHCEVVNFAEAAFVSTQQAIQLLLQLQKGNVPDIVIFYDGAIETYSAYEQCAAGIPVNEVNRAAEFNLSKPERFWPAAMKKIINRKPIDLRWTRIDLNSRSNSTQLAEQVVETFTNNVRLVQALSAAYGFKPLFYLEPTIFRKKQLSAYETKARNLRRISGGNKESLEDFIDTTYGIFDKSIENLSSNCPFYNISWTFADVTEPIYLDWGHIDERGNALIAARICQDVERLVRTNGVSSGSSGAMVTHSF